MKLKWTTDTPTKVGWYWKRDKHGTDIVHIRKYCNELCIANWTIPINVEWAGPIPRPTVE